MGSTLWGKMPQCISKGKSEDISSSKRFHMDQFGLEESTVDQTPKPLECPEMTKEQVQIVTDSWEVLKKDCDHLGILIFIGLFEAHPDIQDMFEPFRGVQKTEMKAKVVPHGLVVLAALDSFVCRLDQAEKFESFVTEFSAKHAGHMNRAEYLDFFLPEFLCAAQTCMKDSWTREMESAWICFLQIVLYYMKKGIAERTKNRNIAHHGSLPLF